MKKGVLSTVAFILALAAFSAYLLLDTFIIARDGDAIVSMGDVTVPERVRVRMRRPIRAAVR